GASDDAARGGVRGQVTLASPGAGQGGGLRGATLRLLPEGATDPAAAAVTTSGDGGAYAFTGVRPGRYVLEASAPEAQPVRLGPFTVKAGADWPLDVTLAPGGAAAAALLAPPTPRIDVRDARSGAPVTRIAVEEHQL